MTLVTHVYFALGIALWVAGLSNLVRIFTFERKNDALDPDNSLFVYISSALIGAGAGLTWTAFTA